MRTHLSTAMLLAFACSGGASAMSYVMPTDETLVDSAHGAIVADVVGTAPSPLPDHVVYLVRTARVLSRGRAAPIERVMLPASGVVGDVGSWAYDAASLDSGLRILIVFERRLDGALLPLHLNLGVFYRTGYGADARYVRALDAGGDVGRRNAAYHAPRDAARFETWISARARGARRAPDYLIEHALPQPLPKFNLSTGGNGLPIRWNAFDAGTTVQWTALTGGQTGMVQDEFLMLQQSLAAWTNDTGSRILLGYAGTVGAIDTHCDNGTSDGNVVLWNDPLNTIGGSFACPGGGTLATAGPCFFAGSPFNIAFEGRLTVQDGAGCFFDTAGGANGAETLTHEIGHTLGFAHSCESGGCVNGTLADQATMRWIVHGDGRGAVLGADDVAAADALYRGAAGSSDPIFANGFE